eukprot:TRINITY_DN89397_c0_g1_i1.p1 TRINITY_DN89397_c0_g1~~TRINITY_DN89397_c0_g1_i1.p1  ORF type:complete len:519 (+),score=29.60 TRINITY_DN89397_c0_g1_i1:61-1617(+)
MPRPELQYTGTAREVELCCKQWPGTSASAYAPMVSEARSKGNRSLVTAFNSGRFVIHPHTNTLLALWDIMIGMLILITLTVTPYELGFPSENDDDFYRLRLLPDIVFALDVPLQFFVSFPHQAEQRWIKKPIRIFYSYARGMFLPDLMSTLPFDAISRGFGREWLRWMKLVRVTRSLRVRRLLHRHAAGIAVPYIRINLVHLMILIFMTVHWIACGIGVVHILEQNYDYLGGWVEAMRKTKPGFFTHAHKEEPFELYTAAVYWSVMTTTTVGYGDVTATNDLEALYMTSTMILSGFVWAYVIGMICSIISNLDAETAAFEADMDSVNAMLKEQHVSEGLSREVREYFIMRKASYHRRKRLELFDTLSPALQAKMAHSLMQWVEAKVWFLRPVDVNGGFVTGFFRSLELKFFPPREIIKLPHTLVIVFRGKVLRNAKVLHTGDVWGMLELIVREVRVHTKCNPLSLSFLELQYITQTKFLALCDEHPEQMKRVRLAALFYGLPQAVKMGLIHPSQWKQV